MPVTGIFEKFEAKERGWHLQHVKLVVGGTGAVVSVTGKEFADGAPEAALGGIVRTGTGVYEVTLPGRGGVQRLVAMPPQLASATPADARLCLVSAVSLADRSVDLTFTDTTPAAADPATGTVIELVFLVKNSSVS